MKHFKVRSLWLISAISRFQIICFALARFLITRVQSAAKAWKVKADELFNRDDYIAKHVKDENMYNYEKPDEEREFSEFEKTED